MTPRQPGEPIKVTVARVEEKVENILGKVECLPDLSKLVTRHDERISTLECAGKWLLGIVAGLVTGFGIFGLVRFFNYIFSSKGGTP